MEAMDVKGAVRIGIDLLDRFGQGSILLTSSTELNI